jgi:hypothetical protein
MTEVFELDSLQRRHNLVDVLILPKNAEGQDKGRELGIEFDQTVVTAFIDIKDIVTKRFNLGIHCCPSI